MRMARTILITALMSGVLAACASPYTSTWSAPDVQPLQPQGKKVAAVVIAKDESTRRNGEVALARELTKLGAVGLPLHELAPGVDVSDESKVREAVERAGVAGVVVMRPTRVDKEISSTGAYATGPYPSFWGGYYGYGWGGAGEITTDTIVSVETLVYAMPDNKLVWAGQSRTTNPGNVDTLVRTLAKQAVPEMEKAGVLAKTK